MVQSRSFLILSLFVCVLFAYGMAESGEQDITLRTIKTDDEFYDHLETEKNLLVLFLKNDRSPEYKFSIREMTKAYQLLLNETTNLDCKFIIVECNSSLSTNAVCRRYEITKTPAISLFSERLAKYDYKDIISSVGITNFVKKYTVPKTTLLNSIEELEDLRETQRSIVVGFFDYTAIEDIQAFRRTAASLIFEYSFFEVALNNEENINMNIEVLDRFDLVPNSVVLFNLIAGKKSQHVMNSPISRKVLTAFLSTHSPVQILELSEFSLEKSSVDLKKPVYILYLNDFPSTSENLPVFNQFEEIAELYKSRFTFAYSVYKGEIPDRIDVIHTFPAVIIKNLIMKEIYPANFEVVTFESMNQFGSDYLAGRLHPFHLKQSPPQEDTSLVKTVVFDTFRDFAINDQGNDAIVIFYLPSQFCKHCGDFVELFEKSALELSSQLPHLKFAKIDMNANEGVPGLFVKNFPTVLYFPKVEKHKEIRFEQKRTYENLINWISQQYKKSHPEYNEQQVKQIIMNDLI